MIDRKLSGHFPTVCKIAIASTITLAGLSVCQIEAIAQPTITPTPTTPLTTPANTNTVEQTLIGEWQLKDVLPIGIKVVFTADNKLYVFLPSSLPFVDGFTQGPIALDFRYRINSSTTPHQIDISSPSGGEPLLSIFELTQSGEMRVEFVGLKAGDPRPTSFTVGSVVLEKLSTITALPRNTQFYDIQAEKTKQYQSNARYSMENINRSQLSYYTSKKKFASSISELGVYVSSNNEYDYKIATHPTQKPGAIATATAKMANLKSYTAAIVAFKNKGKTTTFSGICETETPSKTSPAAPKIDNKGEVTCPSGSTKVE
ncbi:type IV pilin-like G/H family protein [Merismopedia glauca]|uniref:Uncharacterized protein n=1 Tax=Merismopedia glauca CCAP 1448/3 TaxID=1296344 RepID=A0A2T1CAC4_9CYAN|nr:type IV pilin-like G/H family protein [Merismopedia glauca]PSB05189.1 hypothetical protein C7B64_00660 [Merismopedia glauca CCAP 1448/3]